MGLDMYLEATTEPNDVLTYWEEVMYWRKANQIHGYIEDLCANRDWNFENCEWVLLSREDIETLRDHAKEAVEQFYHEGKTDKAEKWFSPTVGFFFGNYDMDYWYWKELERTVVELTGLLEDTDEPYELFRYLASW